MSNPQISIVPYANGFSVSVPASTLALKQQALAKAAPIQQVTNGDEQTAAVQAAAIVKGLIAETEKSRAAVKQPYWDAGKAIDAKAKDFVKELEAEAKRLEGLIASFQRAEQEKAAAAAREAEAKRLAVEAAEQRERDRLAKIEADRIAAEQAAANAKGKKAKEAAEAEAARLRREQAEAELDLSEAANDTAEASATVVQPETPRASGAAVSFVREFEVTDLDAFYAFDLARRQAIADKINRPISAVPSMLRMEVKKNDLKDFISILAEDQLNSIPGVTVIKTAKAAVRGIAPALTLQ